MPMHVVVGAGPIGSTVARLHADRGDAVRVITRSGAGPSHPLIERIAADASDARRLSELTVGATTLYNCANPPYTEWAKLWPPMNDAMIAAARAAGAVYAITGNLYGYGPQPGGRMTENSPLSAETRKGKVRIRMWQDALRGGVRTVEVRGSDYLGAGAAGLLPMMLLSVAKGRTAWAPADIDLPHSFTYPGDMAATLVALAADDRAHGRAWHVPTVPALPIREVLERYREMTGAAPVRVRRLPRLALRAAGAFVPMAREVAEMDYQFYGPFHLDSALTERTFGLRPTPLEAGLREMAAATPSREKVGRLTDAPERPRS